MAETRNAADVLQDTGGTSTETQPKETMTMTTLTDPTDSHKAVGRIAHTRNADLRQTATARPVFATISTAAGFTVQPDTLLLQSLSSADEARSVDRSRYFITTGGVAMELSTLQAQDSTFVTVPCEVTGCAALEWDHDPRESPADWVHHLAPLQGHRFHVSASKAGRAPWGAWVDVDTASQQMTAADLRELAAHLTAEAARVDALNDTAAGMGVDRPE